MITFIFYSIHCGNYFLIKCQYKCLDILAGKNKELSEARGESGDKGSDTEISTVNIKWNTILIKYSRKSQ